MSIGILFWTAAFDILYACQDMNFDKATQLQSIPAKFGINASHGISFVLNILTCLCFYSVGELLNLPYFYYYFIFIIEAILFIEVILSWIALQYNFLKLSHFIFLYLNISVSLLYLTAAVSSKIFI